MFPRLDHDRVVAIYATMPYYIETSQLKGRNSVRSGPLAGDRTTRHPQNYFPSQLPPGPTAHEYLSFPCLLSPWHVGS